MTDLPQNDLIAGKAAYDKAQRQRNLFIGLGLGVFVLLVFFVSMSRMAQGLKHDALRDQAARATAVAQKTQAAAQSAISSH